MMSSEWLGLHQRTTFSARGGFSPIRPGRQIVGNSRLQRKIGYRYQKRDYGSGQIIEMTDVCSSW